MTQFHTRSAYAERRELLRLMQGLNLLNIGCTLVDVRNLVDAVTADYWVQRMRAVPISPGDDGWDEWSAARRASLNKACRETATTPRTPAPPDPVYGDWIPTTTTTGSAR